MTQFLPQISLTPLQLHVTTITTTQRQLLQKALFRNAYPNALRLANDAKLKTPRCTFSIKEKLDNRKFSRPSNMGVFVRQTGSFIAMKG